MYDIKCIKIKLAISTKCISTQFKMHSEHWIKLCQEFQRFVEQQTVNIISFMPQKYSKIYKVQNNVSIQVEKWRYNKFTIPFSKPFLNSGTMNQSVWRSGLGRTRGSPASTTSCWPCSPPSSASPWRAGPLSCTG